MKNQELSNHNPQEELERSVLANLLNHPNKSNLVLQLDEADFVFDWHDKIFSLLKQEVSKDKDYNYVTISSNCSDVELAKYIRLIPLHESHLFDPNSLIANLKAKTKTRKLQKICNRYIEKVCFDEDNIDQIAQEFAEDADNLSKTGNEHLNGSDYIQNCYDLLQSRDDVEKIPTGLKNIDKLDCFNGGLSKGELVGICGQAKACKTTLAITMAYNMALSGKKVVYIACEQSPHELTKKIMARSVGVTKNKLSDKIRESSTYNELIKGINKLSEGRLLFESAPGIDFLELQKVLTHYIYTEKIDCFFIDYYQLVSGQKSNETETQHLKKVIYWLQKIVRKTPKTVGVVLAQLNDEGKARGSRDIIMACDAVLKIAKSGNFTGMYSLSSIAVRNGESFSHENCFENKNGTHLVEM